MTTTTNSSIKGSVASVSDKPKTTDPRPCRLCDFRDPSLSRCKKYDVTCKTAQRSYFDTPECCYGREIKGESRPIWSADDGTQYDGAFTQSEGDRAETPTKRVQDLQPLDNIILPTDVLATVWERPRFCGSVMVFKIKIRQDIYPYSCKFNQLFRIVTDDETQYDGAEHTRAR